jgi:hypothetical protein
MSIQPGTYQHSAVTLAWKKEFFIHDHGLYFYKNGSYFCGTGT